MRRGKNLFKWINISLVFLLLFNPSYVTNAAIQESQSTTDISQWSIHSGADLLSISNEKQVEGTSSLRFEAVPDSLTDLYSAQIDVEGGKEYRVSANVNMTEQVSHSLGFYLVSYDDNGTEIDSHRQGFTADHFPLDEWTDVSFNVGVPVNTASVRIRMYTGSVTDMVAFIDHIQLFEIESSGEQVEIPVPNGSFEEEGSVDPDDPEPEDGYESIENSSFESFEVPGWVIEDPSGGPYITNEYAFEGQQSLKFIARNNSNTDVRTTRVPVEGDKTYKVNAHVNMTELINGSYSFVWYLIGLDQNGNEIMSESKLFKADDFEKDEWVEVDHQATVPAEAEHLVLRMYTGNPTETVAYIDDVQLAEVTNDNEVLLEHDNLGFEDVVSVPEWNLIGGGIGISSEASFSGNYSLEMNQSADETVKIESKEINLVTNETYYFSANFLVKEPSDQAAFVVQFFDQDNQVLDSVSKSLDGEVGEWNSVVLEKEAPENAIFAVVSVENINGYVDLIQVSDSSPDSGADYADTIQNPGFEDELEGEQIPGWTVEETHPDSVIEVTNAQAKSGNNSLYFYDHSPDAGLRIASSPVAVDAGKEYLVQTEAYILYQSHRIVLELEFFDGNDQLLGTETSLFNNLPREVWTTLPIRAEAPNGASYVKVNFYSGGISDTEVYFDDVSMKELEPQSELETNLGDPINLGQPVKVPLAQGGIIGTTPAGDNEVYMVANGDPGVFHVLDAETGELKFKQSLEPGDETVWAMAFGSDDNLYFASDSTGLLYRYDTTAITMEVVGKVPSDDTKVWSLTATDDGKLYGGTYPGATVFEYDITSDEFRNFGRVHPDEQYVRGITASDTHIYAAIGSNKHLMKIDQDTGEIEEVVIETDKFSEHQSGESGFYSDIWIINDKLFIQSGAGKILVVEEGTLEAVHLFAVSDQISQPSPHNSDLIYFKAEDELHTYNMATNEVDVIDGLPPLPDTPRVKSLEWITVLDENEEEKQVLAAVTQYSEYFIYDPVANEIEFIELDVESQAVNIQSLEKSNDNKLYVGGFQRGLSIFDPETDQLEKTFGIFRQAEGIGFKEDIAYFGTYTGAQIYKYDPSDEDNFGSSIDHNPGLVYDVPDEQDRPFAVTTADDYVFVGSVPGYGLLGGSLSIYDEEAGTWESHRNVVEQQSIIGLAYKDGFLYGGTSIWGGQGGAPAKSEAKIFVWDVEKGEKVEEFTPDIPDIDQSPKMIGALSFGEDGLLWGAVDGTIFAMNPDTLEVVKSKVIEPSTYSSSKWRPHYLRWGDDGLLYTTLSRSLIVIDPETLMHKTFDDLGTVDLMTLADDGSVYYASGSRLFKLPLIKDNDALLSDIQIRGNSLPAFDSSQTAYSYSQPKGHKSPYTLTVEPSSSTSNVEIEMPDKVPGTAVVTVTAEDGRTRKVYEVHYNHDTPPTDPGKPFEAPPGLR